MFEDIIRNATAALAIGVAAAAGAAAQGEDPFPMFEASAIALVAGQSPGADGARLTFTAPAVARGAAQMYGAQAQLTIHSFDARACRFAIKVENTAAQLPPALLTGTCALTARIPVAARDLRPGETIDAAALTEAEEPLARIGAGVLRDKFALIGMTPRQPLAAGRPVLPGMIKRKPVIEKGQAVMLRYSAGGLELTAQGIAQGDAATGEAVAVQNIRSRKTVDAVAVSAGVAEIKTAAPARIAAVQ